MAVEVNGVLAGKSAVIDGEDKPYQETYDRFRLALRRGENRVALRHLCGDGLRFKAVVLSKSDRMPDPPYLNPGLKFPTLRAYEAEIKEGGVMLDGKYVRLFAPRRRAKEAKIVFDYLVKAYDELYRLVGAHTEYKIVVYHFPDDGEHGRGGTSNCTIWYGYGNLDLGSQPEWRKHRVPHVSGYIEEMAHNFVAATRAQFGWEMIGWTIGTKVTRTVARNPIHDRSVADTRDTQTRTFNRYLRSGYVFPRDLPANLCDRIHAHVLLQCEKKYGPDFWPHFFREIREAALAD